MFGFLNVYKPKGMTSHDVVGVLRKITGVKQIGHTGTLDPFAVGVLPICIGKATRLIEYLSDEKAYIGKVQFGSSTDTYDIDGVKVKTSDKNISFEETEDALENFRGKIKQTPPIYSAIKIKGKKLYEYARNGEEIEIVPREVNIKTLEILSFDEINKCCELFIECSKGTYVRSIANDLGEKLGCYAHLSALERVKAGKFMVKQSVKLEDIKNIDDVRKYLISPLNYLDYPKYQLNDFEKEKVLHGNFIKTNLPNGTVVLVYNDKIIAMGNSDGEKIVVRKVVADFI